MEAAGGVLSHKSALSGVYLIADARERAVIPFIEDGFAGGLEYLVKQITVGDYNICQRGPPGGPAKILCCIERKTLPDFAASFMDGRYENLNKMLALRAATGCQLFYFVEGPAFPAQGRKFGRVPYKSILAAMTKLMVRDRVFVVQTENEAGTASRLSDLMATYAGTPPAGDPAPTGDPAPAPVCGGSVGGGPTHGSFVGPLQVPGELVAVEKQTDSVSAAMAWMQLRGISIVLGRILSESFSVADLATGQVGGPQIKALKTATGRPINKDAANSLLAIRAGSGEHAVKLVSGLKGISAASAGLILSLAGGTLAALCGHTVESLAAVAIPQKGRTVRLGAAKADFILRILRHRANKHHLPPPPGPVPPGPVSPGPVPPEPVPPEPAAGEPDDLLDEIYAL